MTALRVFGRGFLIVALTAINVGQIAGRHYVGGFVIGGAISFIWWMNSHTAAHSTTRFGRELYAAGAATGTVFGMWLVRLVYGL